MSHHMSIITHFRLIFFIVNEIVEVLLGQLEHFLGIITSNIKEQALRI